MRAGLLTIALIFILGGLSAIISPRQEIVSHPTAGNRAYSKGSTEIVSAERSVVYGWISIGLGTLVVVTAIVLRKSLKVPKPHSKSYPHAEGF